MGERAFVGHDEARLAGETWTLVVFAFQMQGDGLGQIGNDLVRSAAPGHHRDLQREMAA